MLLTCPRRLPATAAQPQRPASYVLLLLLAALGSSVEAAPGKRSLPQEMQALASGNGFAAISPNPSTSVDFASYEALDQSMTLSRAQQQFGHLRNFLAEKRLDFRTGMTGPLNYSQTVQRYRFFDSECRELEMSFDPAGSLIYKRTSAALNPQATSTSLRYFDDSTANASLTLAQAQQLIGSPGIQTGKNYIASPSGGFDQVWRWQQSDKQGWIELGFDGNGALSHLGQGYDQPNTQTDLAAVASQLQNGMSLAQVQTILGAPGRLSFRKFPSSQNPQDTMSVSGYSWDDGSNYLWAEFQSGLLKTFQGEGLDFNNKFAAAFTGSELTGISLGGTVSDVKAQLGNPSNEQQGFLEYRDGEGGSLYISFAPEFVQQPTTPTTPMPGSGVCPTPTDPNAPCPTGTYPTGGGTSYPVCPTATDPNAPCPASTYPAGSGGTSYPVCPTATDPNAPCPATAAAEIGTTTTTPPPPTTPTTPTLRAVNANLNLICNQRPPYTLTPTSSGTLSNRNLQVSLTVASTDQGKTGKLYVIALLPNNSGLLSLSKTRGWQWVTVQTNPPTVIEYDTVTLGSHSLSIFDGKYDLTAASGVRIFVGYGSDITDMMSGDKGDLVHRLRP